MTNEEYCEIMDKSNFMIDSANPYDMKIKEALEKQIPKMVVDKDSCCTICEEMIPRWDYKYCPNCGQKIDWSEYDRAD